MNKQVVEKYDIFPKKIRYKNHVQILEDETGRKIVAKKNHKRNKAIYEYLASRNFYHFPRVFTTSDEEVELTEYLDDIYIEDAQRVEDMIYLLSILHSKTTFYKEIDLSSIKKIYEEMSDSYTYLMSYYQSIQTMIEEETYMSPANYYFILNVGKVYQILEVGRRNLENWYATVSQKKNLRFSLNHNHLKKEHFIENKELYFISWDLAEIGFPINDLVNLFQENYLDINLSTLIDVYQAKYHLMDYEYNLFMAKLCMLKRLNFNEMESWKMEEVTKFNQYIDALFSYFSKQNSSKTEYYPQ